MSIEAELVQKVAELERRVNDLETQVRAPTYKGEQALNFTTTELPRPGDYGTQTNDTELQVNVGGAVRAITTAAP